MQLRRRSGVRGRLCEAESLLRHRHGSNALTRGREHRVRDGGKNRRKRRLSKPAGRIVTLQEVNFHGRRLGDSKPGVLTVIGLHDPSFLERDLLNHFAHAVNDRALHLILGCARIDDVTSDVAGDPYFVDLDLLVCADGDLGDFGKVTAMAEVEGDAERRTFGQGPLSPAGFFRRQLNDGAHARRI